MPKLYEARDTLTRVFNLHTMAAERYVRELQDASALPATTATVDAEHIGRLILAVLASTTPSDAVDALTTFEALELLLVERRERAGDGRLMVTEVQIANEADVPVHMGASPGRWFTLSQAVPLVLEAGGVNEITLCRTTPLLIISMANVRLLYGQRKPPGTVAASGPSSYVDHWVSLAASGIEQISALLTGEPHVPASQGQPAPMVH